MSEKRSLAILDTTLDKNFGHQATKLRKLTTEALRKEAFAGKCTAPQIYNVNAVTTKIPSHVIRCKSKKLTAKKLSGIDEQPNIKPLIVQYQDHGPTRNSKYCKKNVKGGRGNRIVTIGNRLKKILRNIPAGIGMGEPPVAIAERPGKIPEKRGAIFSYAARDLHSQRKTAIAITKNAKAENWYTAANDYLSANSSGITPTWE